MTHGEHVDRELVELTEKTGAAAVLAYAAKELGEQIQRERDRPRAGYPPPFYALYGQLDALYATAKPPATDEELERRLARFAEAVAAAVFTPEAAAGDAVGIVASSGARDFGANFPQATLMYEQIEMLEPVIQWVGRPTAKASWSEWTKDKLTSFAQAVPGLAGTAGWSVLGKIINNALAVGLIPIRATNLVKFGSSLLAPVKALISFPSFMAQQAVLYDLQQYGKTQLRLSDRDPVMLAIGEAISAIDWSAVKVAFTATPAGIFISIYGAGQWLKEKVKPEAHRYYEMAKILVDAADRSLGDTATPSDRLGALTVMHLAGDCEQFFKVMTQRITDAYETLAGTFAL